MLGGRRRHPQCLLDWFRALLYQAIAEAAPGLAPTDREYFAAAAAGGGTFLCGPLMRNDGLVADHIRADGSVEPSVWAYNQALLLQLASRAGDVEVRRRNHRGGADGDD